MKCNCSNEKEEEDDEEEPKEKNKDNINLNDLKKTVSKVIPKLEELKDVNWPLKNDEEYENELDNATSEQVDARQYKYQYPISKVIPKLDELNDVSWPLKNDESDNVVPEQINARQYQYPISQLMTNGGLKEAILKTPINNLANKKHAFV